MRKKLFRFYIKGDREELLETSSHAFTFPALSPGNYELWVSYSKKNGDWSVPLRLLAVDVEPPLWRCAWFLIAMGVIVFAAKTFSGIGKVGDITVSCIEPLSQVMLHLGAWTRNEYQIWNCGSHRTSAGYK